MIVISQSVFSRMKNAWNTFMSREPPVYNYTYNSGNSYRPGHSVTNKKYEKTIISAIYTRFGVDCAQINIKHVQLDDNGKYKNEIDSTLNNCFSLEANIDQSYRSFIQDVVISMLDEGVVAIVPTWTKIRTGDILQIRTGQILEWFPKYVNVRLYNDETGLKEDVLLEKSKIAIVENPLYSVMNETNSTMSRLLRKLQLLDVIDEQSSAGKLDMIIQMPYSIKNEIQRTRAKERTKEIENQLNNTKYGIAYADATEKITQLNRPLENNLMKQVEYLTSMLFSQLGITQTVLDGSANEEVLLNYYNRIIEPIMSEMVIEFKRKFLSKKQISNNESIVFFRDPFKLVPITQLASIFDTLSRNEIVTPNEGRQVLGFVPSEDPKADQLLNRNMGQNSQSQDSTTI